MAQAATATRCRLLFILAAALAIQAAAFAQNEPYVLLNGPTERTTYRFAKGEQLEWRLVDEAEFFVARITDLFPESQAIRLEDLLIGIDRVAEVRFRRRGAGLRRYALAQGSFNLALIGIVSAAGGLAEGQRNFAISSAAVSSAMVLFGLIGKRRSRKVSADARFVLKVAGGDITVGDDPNRG